MKTIRLFLLLNAFVLAAAVPAPAAPQDSMRRFALVVGADDGGPERGRLQYAESDARLMTRLLQKLGGVFPIDCVFLLQPDRERLLGGFRDLQEKIRRARETAKRIELVFYYSGHSDEEAVLLGQDRLSYQEIKRSLDRVPADVRIAILDSCSSGAFTRLKGGQMRPPFLLDEANDMKGSAYLTSSASDEASQESDKLQSSFFTHFLTSGLRGAADTSQDGRVSLHEAYQYAYHETLNKTEKTLGGPQHPNYNIQMTGTGDVVMTDIRNSSAILTFDQDLYGRFLIRDQNERIVLEMRKPEGRSLQIGLEEGVYQVSNERDQRLFETRVELTLGQELVLNAAAFGEVAREAARLRGEEPAPENKFAAPGYQVVPWDVTLVPDSNRYARTIHYCVLGLVGSTSAKLDGFALSPGLSLVIEEARGVQCTGLGNSAGREMEGVQLAGLFNSCAGSMKGVQSAGILNSAKGQMAGVQAGGVLSLSQGAFSGLQSGGVLVHSEDRLNGVQAAGVYTLARGKVSGVQAAGVFAYADKDFEGVQASGVFNYTGGRLQGLQISTVNLAETSDGLQIGVVNLAGEQRGESLGLVSLAENGRIETTAWWDNLSGFNLGVRFRANHLYSLLSVSRKSPRAQEAGWGGGIHLGGRMLLEPFYVDLDLGFSGVNNPPADRFDETDLEIADLRLMPGATWGRFSVFAGIGMAYIYRGRLDTREGIKDGATVKTDLWTMIEQKWSPLYLVGAAYSF
ncbi:MAG: caspase family protein [candidate division FCPU426 bacterium]